MLVEDILADVEHDHVALDRQRVQVGPFASLEVDGDGAIGGRPGEDVVGDLGHVVVAGCAVLFGQVYGESAVDDVGHPGIVGEDDVKFAGACARERDHLLEEVGPREGCNLDLDARVLFFERRDQGDEAVGERSLCGDDVDGDFLVHLACHLAGFRGRCRRRAGRQDDCHHHNEDGERVKLLHGSFSSLGGKVCCVLHGNSEGQKGRSVVTMN